MKNDNAVMCQLEEEGSNGKQQCGDTSFPTEEKKGKHRRNWYHFISTPCTLSKYHHARGHPHCLTVPEVTKDENETSISGAELECHPTSVPSMLYQ